MESRYENQVFLDPSDKDIYGVPTIKARLTYSPRDLEVIRRMEAGMRQASIACQPNWTGTNAEPDICRILPGADYHEFGTSRMGDDPLTSAADRYGQIHGISSLYVADNSVLPPIGGANPTLTTVALAIRTADNIRSRE
ncbi:GMC family oxidoreductase [Paenibacillus solisilvae]|uniref:GMC family oxidoreductase n=1 Tax=Paenibacillus solisilvae TaxID=2486751 RepID=A0ABW0VTP1_9BACL